MKISIFLLLPLLFSCQAQPETESIEYKNVAPLVEIQGSDTLANGEEAEYKAVITDPDDTEFLIEWDMQGNSSEGRTVYFSARPENDSEYLLTVTVSDGKSQAFDSMLVSVSAPSWVPEKLHVYIFSNGEILKEYTATADTYASLYRRAKATVDLHNRDNPDDIWILKGGGI